MTTTLSALDNLTLNITQEIHVRSSPEATFQALLEQIGPHNIGHEGGPMPMVVEPWPGGRWYRDLGDRQGHFWGHVQAIKPPTLFELTGPMFMSMPVLSNVQYRLTKVNGGTIIAFRHTAFGVLPDGFSDQLSHGWTRLHDAMRARAESK